MWSLEASSEVPQPRSGLRYILLMALTAATGALGLSVANRQFAPEMYSKSGPVEIAEALAAGQNYAVFDLNVNIREIRDAHIARMPVAPELAILGASHWQEAHMDLLPGINAYNAHVHRDYWEDMLGMAEMFIRHDKLPKRMVISIRDNLFTPVEKRKDHLWLPGVPYYRAMAKRLGLKEQGIIETLPVARWREIVSVPMLFENVTRWFNAEEHPHATSSRYLKTLDTLLPDGSIIWSREHRALFTQKRTNALSVAFANVNAGAPPQIDPKGVEAIEALLIDLKSRGVEVIFAHPPFNPDYFERVRKAPYMAGLERVKNLAKRLAEKHGLRTVGSFDPADIGCDASMYIDAEHANSDCLGRIMHQIMRPDAKPEAPQVVAGTGFKFDFGTPPQRATIVAASAPAGDAPKLVIAQAAALDAPKAASVKIERAPSTANAAAKTDDLALQQLAILKNANAMTAAREDQVQPHVAASPSRELGAAGLTLPLSGKADDLALQQAAILANARKASARDNLGGEGSKPMASVIASAPSDDRQRSKPLHETETRPSTVTERTPSPPKPTTARDTHRTTARASARRVIKTVVIERGWPGDPVRRFVVVQNVPAGKTN